MTRLLNTIKDPFVAEILKSGGIAVLRTDTLYGIVASARDKDAVERIYDIKQRTPSKSPIVLIDSIDQLFDTYDTQILATLHAYWPGPNSIILPSVNAPQWITRNNESVAYRIPNHPTLRSLLRIVGPIIAPSANPEGALPAATVKTAQKYFGDKVDVYVDEGEVLANTPSSLYLVDHTNQLTQLR